AVRARILARAAPVGRHHLDGSAPGPIRARTRAIADPVGWAAEGPAASAIGAGLTEGAVHGDVLRAPIGQCLRPVRVAAPDLPGRRSRPCPRRHHAHDRHLRGLPGGFLAPQIIFRGIAPRAFLVSFGVSAVLGYLGLLFAPATTPVVWAILLGYGGFAFPPALALITSRTREVPVTAATSAFVQSSGYVLAAIGPLAVGGLLGWSGGWAVPLWFMIAISVLMGITGWLSAGPGSVDEEVV